MEKVRDLLNTTSKELKIREDQEKGVHVDGNRCNIFKNIKFLCSGIF